MSKDEKITVEAQEVIELHHVRDGEQTKGWQHTHGMSKFNLPELEMRGVPGFLADAAARILNDVCNYMLNGEKRVREGEVMSIGERCRFRVVRAEPIAGYEDHYREERWQLVDVPCACAYCGKVTGESVEGDQPDINERS